MAKADLTHLRATYFYEFALSHILDLQTSQAQAHSIIESSRFTLVAGVFFIRFVSPDNKVPWRLVISVLLDLAAITGCIATNLSLCCDVKSWVTM